MADEKKMKLDQRHPLVGTWITDDEDSNVALVIKVVQGRFRVTGFCRSDGECLKITKVDWDGKMLSFETVMPSTGCKTRQAMRPRPDGKVELELTYWEIWKKKKVKPNELPEAWATKTTKLPTKRCTAAKNGLRSRQGVGRGDR